MTPKHRLVLATLGAHGILGHNSAVQMPAEFTEKAILRLCQIGTAELPPILEELENQGYVRSWDTGHYGYGDHYVPGKTVYGITAAGLVALWTGV